MKSDPEGSPRRRNTSPLARSIGRRIRALRRERGWTPRHLAGLLGVTVEQVEDYELGGALPTLRTLIFLAQVFRVSIDSLVLEEPEALLPLEDEALLRRFRQVGMLPPEARGAAADLLDIFLALHGYLHAAQRPRPPMPPPGDPEDADLRIEDLAGAERQAAGALLELLAGMRRFAEARKAQGTGQDPPADGEGDGAR